MDDETRAAVEKVESLVRLLSQDVGELRRKVDSHDASFQKVIDLVSESRKETDSSLRVLANAQASMASAVTQAVAQLTLAQSLEKRVDRLEAAVFPPKH